jgi:hypothetical protein
MKKALMIGAAICTAATLAVVTNANATEPKRPDVANFDIRFVGENESFAEQSRATHSGWDSSQWQSEADSEGDSWSGSSHRWDHAWDHDDHWDHDWHRGGDRGDDDIPVIAVVPEAATWQLLAVGAALFGVTRMRARRRR